MARDSTEFARQSGERAMQAATFGMTWAREFAEEGFTQSRQAFDSLLRVSRKMAEDFEDQACAMREHATALTEKTLANTMEFGQKLARAKEPQEIAQCQSEFLARQAQMLDGPDQGVRREGAEGRARIRADRVERHGGRRPAHLGRAERGGRRFLARGAGVETAGGGLS